MNIFITGSKGFIGSHLSEYLKSRYTDYKLFLPSREELDLSDETAVEEYILGNKIDIIIHTANKGGGRDVANMDNVTEYNLRIFFNIVKHEPVVKKIISFGSGAEYSKQNSIINVTEEDSLKSLPLDEYGFYKSITSKFIEKSDKMVQLRVFGAYGEKENYRFKFISNAIVKNLLKQPIHIKQNVYFDYIYVDDLVKCIDWFIHNESKEKIYNITTGQKVDLLSLANFVNECSDFQSDIHVLTEGLNNEYTSSNKRLMKELKGFTFMSHKEAILKMRSYFKKNIEYLDKRTILDDPYLKEIENMWKGKK